MQLNRTIFEVSRRRRAHSAGGMLVEVGAAVLVMIVLAVVGIPMINSYIIDGRVPAVADDLRRFMTRNKVNGSASADPNSAFQQATQRAFAMALNGSTALSVNATTFVVQHNLGSGGVIVYAPADGGKGYSLTADRVHSTACPTLAGILNRDSNKITINGVEQKNTETPVNFSSTNAEAACTDGETNTLVFTSGNYEIASGAR
jgi:hypothetical protein